MLEDKSNATALDVFKIVFIVSCQRVDLKVRTNRYFVINKFELRLVTKYTEDNAAGLCLPFPGV